MIAVSAANVENKVERYNKPKEKELIWPRPALEVGSVTEAHEVEMQPSDGNAVASRNSSQTNSVSKDTKKESDAQETEQENSLSDVRDRVNAASKCYWTKRKEVEKQIGFTEEEKTLLNTLADVMRKENGISIVADTKAGQKRLDELRQQDKARQTDALRKQMEGMFEESDFEHNADGTIKTDEHDAPIVKQGVLKEIQQEQKEIYDKAKADGRIKTDEQGNEYAIAPNGERSNLSVQNWLQTRTARFKKWFGDWEKAAVAKAIESLSTVKVVSHDYSKSDLKAIYKQIGSVLKDGRMVLFGHRAFGKNYKEGGLFAKIIPQIDEIFKGSILAYEQEDNLAGTIRRDGTVHKEHRNISKYSNYVGKCSIDGKTYYVRFTVQEEKTTGGNVHSTFVTNVELYNNTANVASAPTIKRGGRSDTDSITDAKLQNFFESAREAGENSSKIVDENGEPLVVYHGTRGAFSVFDRSKGGQTQTASRVGFWFTPTKSFAQNFALGTWWGEGSANVIDGFISLRNPKIYDTTLSDDALNKEIRQQMSIIDKEMSSIIEKYKDTYWKTSQGAEGKVYKYLWELVLHYRVDNPILENKKAEAEKASKESERALQIYQDVVKYKKLRDEHKELENRRYDNIYTDAFEKFRTDIYKMAGKNADDANSGGLGRGVKNLDEAVERYRQELLAQGYDGIIIRNTRYDRSIAGGNNTQYVVFDSNQIKSATGNVGTFSEKTDDIRFYIGKKKRGEYEARLKKAGYSNEDIAKQLDFLHGLEQNKEQDKVVKVAVDWLAKKGIQDVTDKLTDIEKAIKVAELVGTDITQYSSPQAVFDGWSRLSEIRWRHCCFSCLRLDIPRRSDDYSTCPSRTVSPTNNDAETMQEFWRHSRLSADFYYNRTPFARLCVSDDAQALCR